MLDEIFSGICYLVSVSIPEVLEADRSLISSALKSSLSLKIFLWNQVAEYVFPYSVQT